MLVSNFNNTHILVKSDYIDEVISSPGDFTSIIVTANINCCVNSSNEEVLYTETIDPTIGNKWYVDLSTPVGLDSMLNELNLRNISVLNKFNVLSTPIDLSYVSTNCSGEGCTLQTFSGYFAPIFKTAIDTYFAGVGITSNVTITSSGNILIIEGLPTNFIGYDIIYGDNDTSIPFGFNGVTSKLFLGSNGIYINPSFFGLTTLMDGVYKITVKILKEDNSYTQETNCSFIDITVACKVASVLNKMLEESRVASSEKCATMIHMLHYGLVNGSNCGCNCEEMCKVYTELLTLLNELNPQITSDCGC